MSDNTLNKFYETILETAWMIVDPETNYVYRDLASVSGEAREPFILLDKQVALPTRENLNASGSKNLLIFHPLLEGLMGGESPVIGKLRRAFGIRFTYAATSLFSLLLSSASHSSEVSKFSPEQMGLLKVVGEVNEKTLATWDKIVKLSTEKFGASNSFADVYTSRNTSVNGQAYTRVASVRFPIYEELVKDDAKFFGSSLQISKNDRKIFMKLFEFMFPNLEIKDSYTHGTNSRVAPYLDALLNVFGKLFSITNKIYHDYNSVIEMEKNIYAEIEWLERVRDIESLKNVAQSVPQQFGNYPIKVEDEKRQSTGSAVGPLDIAKQKNIGHQYIEPVGEKPKNPQHNSFAPLKPDAVEVPVKPGAFQGLGVPLDNANGVIFEKELSVKANLVDSITGTAMVDPMRAMASVAQEVIRRGGVGRVSANQVNVAAMQALSNPAPIFQPTTSDTGWNNSNNSFNGNGGGSIQNHNLALVARNAAYSRIMSDPPAFGSNNVFSTGSAI